MHLCASSQNAFYFAVQHRRMSGMAIEEESMWGLCVHASDIDLGKYALAVLWKPVPCEKHIC